jgi:homoserine kinase
VIRIPILQAKAGNEKARTENCVSVRVPATSANLGCAFDCAALALSLYLKICVSSRDDGAVTVRYNGVNPERVPADESNLIARTISQTLAAWQVKRGFDLEIDNQIPVGVGLGSSAAAIVGALAACGWLADKPLSDEDLLSSAASIEGHPDNVAAAWHGGFTVAMERQGRVAAYSCPLPDSLHLVLVVPDYALPTEEARRVLPTQYSRTDAVHNLQRAAMLAAEFFSGRGDLNPALFSDCWHQPHRAGLVPGLSKVLALKHPDLLGTCLSGAGPSILAFVRGSAQAIGGLIQGALRQEAIESCVQLLSADNLGAKGWCLLK